MDFTVVTVYLQQVRMDLVHGHPGGLTGQAARMPACVSGLQRIPHHAFDRLAIVSFIGEGIYLHDLDQVAGDIPLLRKVSSESKFPRNHLAHW